jgi:hypothetical protein
VQREREREREACRSGEAIVFWEATLYSALLLQLPHTVKSDSEGNRLSKSSLSKADESPLLDAGCIADLCRTEGRVDTRVVGITVAERTGASSMSVYFP